MKYAIVESGGKQYRAVEGGTLEVDRLPVEPGANVKLEQVLLLADGENITVGTPVVEDNPVWTKVVEHFKGKKVMIFNYSPKKRIRVKTGHRQNYTRLFVEQVGGSKLVKKEPVKTEEAVEAAAMAVETKKTEKPAKAAPKAAAEKKPAPKKTASAAEKKPAAKTPAKKPSAQTAATAKTGKTEKKPATKPAAKKTTPKE